GAGGGSCRRPGTRRGGRRYPFRPTARDGSPAVRRRWSTGACRQYQRESAAWTENRRLSGWAPHSYQIFPQPFHARLITKQMVGRHAAAGQCGVHDVPSTRPEGDVGDSTAFSKEEQVPRLVAFSIRGDRDLFSLAELLIAVARQPNAACRVHRLREPRAIDAPLGAATPEIGCAGKPLERELGQREMSRFHAYLLFPAYEAGGHRSFLTIREFHHAAAQRDARTCRQPAPGIGRDNVRAE